MGNEAGRRAKVHEEARSRNRYTFWLGLIAAVGLFLGTVGLLINAIFGRDDLYGYAERAADPALLNPAFVVGAICGVLWLVVKAITSQQAPPRQ